MDHVNAAIADAEHMATRTIRALYLAGAGCAITGVAVLWALLDEDGEIWAWLTSVVTGFFVVAAIILTIRWFVRVYDAAEVAGRVEPHSSRYLVWVWFIPGLGMFRPKELLNDVWRATDPGAWGYPRYFQAWWAAWLCAPLSLTGGDGWVLAGVVLEVVGAWLTIRVVRDLTDRLGRLRVIAPAREAVAG